MTKKNTAVKSSSPEEFLSVRDRLLACETVKWAEGFSFVAGVDEAGRGCMAGPVAAAAVVFTERNRIPAGVFDSKQLSHAERMRMRERILAGPSILYAVGEVSPEEIDRINILRATWKAMGMALEQLKEVQFALIDGNPVKGLPVPSQSIVKGDAKSASIAAASILAKTHRDLYMEKIAAVYPEYHFEIHKGYCTELHTEAVRKYGPCPIHRMTFEPVRSILNPPTHIQPELF